MISHRPDLREAELLGALAPAHLRVEVRLDRGDWREALGAAQETAAAIGSRLEVSLHLLEAHVGQLDERGVGARAMDRSVERVLVINADSRTGTPAETTRPELVDSVRAALGQALPETHVLRRDGDLLHRDQPHTARTRHVGRRLLLAHAAGPRIHRRRRHREPRRTGGDGAQRAGDRGRQARRCLADHHASASQFPCRRRPAA